MANSSEYFTSIDQITSRPNFSVSLQITVDSFSSLIGRYYLSEGVQCQVKTERGICRQKHQHGYVGITKEGKEGLIGGICGNKYFKGHTLFVQEKNRIDAEIDRRENIDKLIAYKNNFLLISKEYTKILQSIQAIKKKTDHLYNGFPDVVLSYLYHAQKTKNWDLNVDVLHHSQDENKETSKWYVEKLCTFPPLPSAQEIQSLLSRVEKLKAILNEACSSKIEELSTPKLKGYVKSLSAFSELETIYNKFDKYTEEFTQYHILSNLYYACAKHKNKLDTIKTILTLNKPNISEQLVKHKCDEIERITEEKFNHRQVRYNKTVIKFKKSSIG